MKTLIFVLASMLLVTGLIITPSQAAEPSQGIPAFAKFIGGTIESVDPSALKVTLLTDVGKTESFPVADASILMGVTKGDRVSCEMDDQGMVRKIVKTTDPKGTPAPDPKG
jgi:Cu/Ag efflux protein CusF